LKWKDPSTTWLEVTTTTIAQPGKSDEVLTAKKGVSALKNAQGGLNIAFSPAIKAKLEAVAKEVTPCVAAKAAAEGAAERRLKYIKRQAAGSCGVANFVERAGQDAEIRQSFSAPVTDQMWREDEGYESGSEVPGPNEGYEGEGFPEAGNSGPFHDDEGFFEGEAGETTETIVVGTAEEAAAIEAGIVAGQGLSGAGALAVGGLTLSSASLLAVIYPAVRDGLLPAVATIPKENIHKISRPKESGANKPRHLPSHPPARRALRHVDPLSFPRFLYSHAVSI